MRHITIIHLYIKRIFTPKIALLACFSTYIAVFCSPTQAITVASPREDSQYFSLSEIRLNEMMLDSRGLVNPQFRVPERLRELVEFWTKVYVQYSSLQIVVYDREFPSVIYGVIDFRDLYQKGLSPIALEITSKQRTQKTKAEFYGAFNLLATRSRKQGPLSGLATNLVQIWSERHPELMPKNSKEWQLARERLRFQFGQRDRVIHSLKASHDFQFLMEALFSENDLPPQLARLCLLESSFVIKAQSKADAVGVWQFLKSSAREYMRVDEASGGIDERLSPIKSTIAAIKFLKRNLRVLGDLPLTIISYNHGIRGLLKVKKEMGNVSVVDLLNGKHTAKSPLGFASRNYYAEFLAMVHAEAYRNFLYSLESPPTKFQSVKILTLLKDASVFQIAANEGLNLEELQLFNPDVFKLDVALRAGTKVVIPKRQMSTKLELLRKVSVPGIGLVQTPEDGVPSG